MDKTDYITPKSAQTLHGLFLERVARTPDGIAYRYFDKETSQWLDIRWQEMKDRVSIWRRALLEENLTPGDRVALMLPNSPEWACFDLAALSLGLVVVPLFANDRPENIAYILEETEASILLCPGLAYWEDLEPVLHRLKHIRRIITLDHCKIQQDDLRINCSSDWLAHTPSDFSSEFTDPEALASIVFTSGTTGLPKGVMLSHRNILENSYAGLLTTPIYPDDLFLSFLPMSHMLERTVGYYLAIMAGSTVAFVRSIPQLAEDLRQIRPTALIAVPRIFERVYAGIMDSLEKKSGVAKALFSTAVSLGWKKFEYDQGKGAWSPAFFLLPLLDRLVASKVRERLGGRLRIIISGGAPLAPEIAQLFIGLGLPLLQGYGLTETSPVVSVNRLDNNDPSGVGLPLEGVRVKLGDDEELLVKGSCIMQGYWKNPEATAAIFDQDGWLRTGDKADIRDGHIHITGRLKEIIVLSNSEKVPPADLEMAICLDPLFEQVMVVGENRPYLTMVGVLNKEHWSALCASLEVPEEQVSLDSEQIQKEVLARIEKQLQPFPGFAWIKKVALTLEPWTVENDLLTPTLKIKRRKVEELMRDKIEEMYPMDCTKTHF